jgi:hypothetical protein
MTYLNLDHPPKRREKTGCPSHSLAHERPDNDNLRPTEGFQYLQLAPMAAVFLLMVALVWIVAIAL